MQNNKNWSDANLFSLPKFVYTISAVIVGFHFGVILLTNFFMRDPGSNSRIAYYPLDLLLFVVISGIAILTYRRVFLVVPFRLSNSTLDQKGFRSRLNYMLQGVATGLVVFGISLVFLELTNVRAVSRISFLKSGPFSVLLITVLVPIASEALFRGVAFRTLAIHGDVPSAIVGSALLSALLGPVFGILPGALLGAASGLLYYRSRSLASGDTQIRPMRVT